MAAVDILIIVVILLPAIIGAVYGFLNIVFSIIAWALAAGISLKFGRSLAPLLENHVDTPLIREVLAFLGLFIVSLMLLSLLGFFIVKLLGRAGLTAADRILGLFFGIGLGAAIIWVIVFLAGFTALPREPWWQDSILLEPFETLSLWAEQFLPDNMVEYHGYAPIEASNRS